MLQVTIAMKGNGMQEADRVRSGQWHLLLAAATVVLCGSFTLTQCTSLPLTDSGKHEKRMKGFPCLAL